LSDLPGKEAPWPFNGGWTQGSHLHLTNTGKSEDPGEQEGHGPKHSRSARRAWGGGDDDDDDDDYDKPPVRALHCHWDLQIYKPLRFPIVTHKRTDQRQKLWSEM